MINVSLKSISMSEYSNSCSSECAPGVDSLLYGSSFISLRTTECKSSEGVSICPQQCNFGEFKKTCSLKFNSCKVSLLFYCTQKCT